MQYSLHTGPRLARVLATTFQCMIRYKAARLTSALVFLVAFALVLPLAAQTCDTKSSTPLLVSLSGLTERTGDIALTCTGGTSGTVANAQLFVSLNTSITNRIDVNGRPINITIGSSGAVVTSDAPTLVSGKTIQITNASYMIPSPNSSPVTIRISGIRAAVAPIANGGAAPTPVTASVVAVGFNLPSDQQTVTTALGTRSLLASVLNGGIPCAGQYPDTYDLPGFFAASTTASTVRVTEGAPNGFAVKDASTDTGTRIVVTLSGYGSGVRLFVPDALVGNDGVAATSAGQFGATASGGTYSPGNLLLSRVNGADANGNGGTLAQALPGATTSFTAASELTVANGSAFAVYEVLDGNATLSESVQVPVFVIPLAGCGNSADTSLSVSAGPVSSVAIATATDPIPRYVADSLTPDCQLNGDCAAGYFPVLSVDTAPINLTGAALGAVVSGFIDVANNGGSQLNFTASISYQDGSNWVSVTPAVASNDARVIVRANPSTLTPGTYKATITINGGSAGSATVPVTFSVGPAGVTIQSTVNAATFVQGAIAPGSYVALFGVNLAGSRVGVTFNGLPGTIAYDSAGQINAIVPASLAGQHGASVVATVDSQPSPPFVIALAPNAPGIFDAGIVNPDLTTVNTAGKPAARGGIIQIYLTGLAIPVSGLTVTMGDRSGIIPLFAGAQPTYEGLDQVNVTIPADLSAPGGVVPVSVCVPAAQDSPVCSNSIKLYVQ